MATVLMRSQCAIDDVVPLHTPVTLRTGEVVDKLVIAAGSSVSVPIQALNRSKRIWGDDAWEFNPERWLDGEAGLPQLAKEMQGFHHLLTFIDGPRTCLGKTFAVTEIKVRRCYDRYGLLKCF
jgi:cytochrome P450